MRKRNYFSNHSHGNVSNEGRKRTGVKTGAPRASLLWFCTGQFAGLRPMAIKSPSHPARNTPAHPGTASSEGETCCRSHPLLSLPCPCASPRCTLSKRIPCKRQELSHWAAQGLSQPFLGFTGSTAGRAEAWSCFC